MEDDVLTHLSLPLFFNVNLLAAELDRVDALTQFFVTLEVETEVALDVIDFLAFLNFFIIIFAIIK